MSKKDKDVLYPFELIKDYKQDYPDFWLEVDKLNEKHPEINSFEEGNLYNNAFIDIVKKLKNEDFGKNNECFDSAVEVMMAIARWRETKIVYTFTKELFELLCDGHLNDVNIPNQLYEMLPYNSLLIRTEHKQDKHEFLVHKTKMYFSEDNTFTYGLSFVIFKKINDPVYGDGFFREIFLLPCDGSISIDKWLKDTEGNKENIVNDINYESGEYEELPYTKIQTLRQYIQMLLYIISINADIKSNVKQDSIFKRGPVIVDKYNEIKKWEVGETISKNIRLGKYERKKNWKEEYENPIVVSGVKRPHLRMSHWHHYWTGKKDEPENRKLILKWLPPIYVNFDDFDNLPIKESNYYL